MTTHKWILSNRMNQCLVLLLLLALMAPVFAASEDMQYTPWRSYTLGVELATDDPEVVNQESNTPNARYIMVRFSGLGGVIQLSDIVEYASDIVLCDQSGTTYEHDVFGITRLNITNGQFSMADEQDAFSLYYEVPSDIQIDTLSLRIATDVPAEHVIVSLATVSRTLESDGEAVAEEEVAEEAEEAAPQAGKPASPFVGGLGANP